MSPRLILIAMLWLTVGCSNQWREADAGVSAEEMLSLLEEVQQNQGQSFSGSGSLSEAIALKDEPGVRIYFAESTGVKSPLGSVPSVLSLTSFAFLGLPTLTWNDILETRIFFMDLPTSEGRRNSLIMGIRRNGESTLSYAAFTGSGEIIDEELFVDFAVGGTSKVAVQSFDIVDGDLDDVIQLAVYDYDSQVVSRYIGKIPTLVGYGD